MSPPQATMPRILLLALLLVPLAASAQEKSPGTATAFSVVIPGGGQFYAGETGKGAAILLGTGTALATGVAVAKREPYFGCPSPCWEFDTAPLAIGAGVAGAIWLYGIVDAPSAARRANRRRAQITALPTLQGARVQVSVPL